MVYHKHKSVRVTFMYLSSRLYCQFWLETVLFPPPDPVHCFGSCSYDEFEDNYIIVLCERNKRVGRCFVVVVVVVVVIIVVVVI